MVTEIAIYVLAGTALVIAWHCWFARLNRRRAFQALRWIEKALARHGRVGGVYWLSPSRFSVPLRLKSSVFQQASLLIELLPRELPLNWLLSRVRKRPDLLTFQADLDYAPSFDLEISNHCWFGRTSKKIPSEADSWHFERVTPFVMTTRDDWEREITAMMDGLLASRALDFLSIAFHRNSPHLRATIPLNSLSPEAQSPSEIFQVLRELASGASTTSS